MRDKYNIRDSDVDKFHRSQEGHVLNMQNDYNEQAWLNERPVFFHFGRSGYKRDDAVREWQEKAGKYLDG